MKNLKFIVMVLFVVTISALQFSLAQTSQDLQSTTLSSQLNPIYYADLSLVVENDGSVIIVGTTNDPDFSDGVHQKFTSKKGEYWLLNLSSTNNYSDYIVSIKLPQGTEFNYLKTDGRSRISYDDGIRVIASGSGTLNVLIQYKIVPSQKSYVIPLIVFVLIIIFVSILIYFRNNEKKKQKARRENGRKNKYEFQSKQKNFELEKNGEKKNTSNMDRDGEVKNKLKNEKIELLKQTLTDNQFQILRLLMDAEGKLTQKQLQHRSGMAKATLSRNVELLSKKNIVTKQSRGLTNMIILNKEMIE